MIRKHAIILILERPLVFSCYTKNYHAPGINVEASQKQKGNRPFQPRLSLAPNDQQSGLCVAYFRTRLNEK